MKKKKTAKVVKALVIHIYVYPGTQWALRIFFHTTVEDIKLNSVTRFNGISFYRYTGVERKSRKSQEVKIPLEDFTSGDAIVLCSLITSLPAGLVPIMSANSQFSSVLLSSQLPCPQLAFLSPQKMLISTSISLIQSQL